MPSANTALFNQQCTEGNYLLEMLAYLRKGASPQRAVIFILFAHTKAPMAAEIYPGPFAKEAQITTQCF